MITFTALAVLISRLTPSTRPRHSPDCLQTTGNGLGGPNNEGGHIRRPGGFFMSSARAASSMAGRVGEPQGSPVPSFRSANPARARHPLLAEGSGIQTANEGASAMRNTASGTRALAPTTPTTTPTTLDFLRDQLADAREQVDRLLATPPTNAVELAFYQGRAGAFELALAALDEGRSTSTTTPASHTRGPWFVFKGGWVTSRDPDHHYVAQVCHDRNCERHIANEALIVAAPDQHQALTEIIADYRADLALIRPRTMKLIRAALAKADGGAA